MNFHVKEWLEFPIVLPSIPEQSLIATILNHTEALIDQTDRLIQKYRRIKRGLMQDLFRYGIDEQGNLRSEKTHRFRDSQLGWIPEMWEIKELSKISEKIVDKDHVTPQYVEDGIPILSPKDFTLDEKIDFTHCAKISLREHLINKKKTDLKIDDIIITRIGSVGKTCIVNKDMPEFSILHSAAMIRGNNRKILPLFLLYSLKSDYLQKQIIDGIQSIGVPDLGLDKIMNFLVKVPKNIQEQNQIATILLETDMAIEQEESYKQKLLALKAGLMDDLLSGKVRVNHLIHEEVVA